MWKFDPISINETQVTFESDFELRSYALTVFCRLFVDEASGMVVDAFEKRCATQSAIK